LHPHLLLREVLKDATVATVGSPVTEGGATFDVIEVKDAIHPIKLFVAADGHIAKATTLVNDFLRRDTELEVIYENWQGEGVKFPNKVTIKYAGENLHIEDRTKVEASVTIAADQFTIPATAMPMFDAALAQYGEETPEFFQMFTSIGIPIDARANAAPMATEVVPGSGVYHLGGAVHNSLAIEQANGIVIVEGPHSPERADAIIAWAKTMFPTKPITHVIATHHHQDHTAGLRSFVSVGAKVVVHEASKDFYGDVFKAASTVVPDTLAQTPMTPAIESVVAATDTVIGNVTVRQFTNPHCLDMVLVHVALPANAGVVFESDLYNPGMGGNALSPAFAKALLDGINALPAQLDVTIVAGGHGGFAPLAELTAYVAANPVP
jgi:glyoxylase-like metal-dependent hydrolase (beta-lactamase superfamily II)